MKFPYLQKKFIVPGNRVHSTYGKWKKNRGNGDGTSHSLFFCGVWGLVFFHKNTHGTHSLVEHIVHRINIHRESFISYSIDKQQTQNTQKNMNRIYHRSLLALSKRRGHDIPRFLSTSNGSRESILQQKQRDLFAMMESHQEEIDSSLEDLKHNNNRDGIIIQTTTQNSTGGDDMIQPSKHLQEQRATLIHDAGIMTKSLYRSCLRCVQLIRHGNEHDMADFDEREKQQKLNRSKQGFSGFDGFSSSLEPPVDRDNELSSRAMYYLAFAKESFHQEIDCLEQDPWRIENVKRFLYLMRQGEERRKWLLQEYKFEDPYAEKWNEDKLLDWEEKAWKLVKETYESNGWVYQKDGDVTVDEVDTIDDGIDWDETYDDDEEDGRFKRSR